MQNVKVSGGWADVKIDDDQMKVTFSEHAGQFDSRSLSLRFTKEQWDELMEHADIVLAQIELAEKMKKSIEKNRMRREAKDLQEWEK